VKAATPNVHLADLVTDPLCLIDTSDQTVVQFNLEFSRIMPSVEIGRPIHELLPLNADTVRARIGRGRPISFAWTSPKQVNYRFKLTPHAQGVMVHGVRVKDPRQLGGIAGADMVQARLEQLIEEREQAKRTAANKSTFLAHMSHELRTPMNGVMGLAQLLQDTDLNELQLRYVNAILSSSKALLTVINDILDLSKIQAGKQTLHIEVFNLQAEVANVIEVLRPQANGKGITLDLVCAPSLPSRLEGDAGRIRQIMMNLIGNAVKFTTRGGVTVEIDTLDPTTDPLALTLKVRDTGIGIAPVRAAAIFKPFEQADSGTTRTFGGTGLGLSIARGFVRLMGGSMGVDSVLGKGSTFWVRVALPVAEAGPDEPDIGRRQNRMVSSVGIRVLVAEDNRVNRLVVVAMLERLGCDVDVAHDGAECVEMWKQASYDMVLMDCEMPILDGYQATAEIRSLETNKHTPIVALTANAMREDVQRATDKGMDDHMAKPFLLADLEALLQKWAG
jgi:signal transduction histidine kinase